MIHNGQQPEELHVRPMICNYFLIAFFGIWRRKEEKILIPQKTFAILIAAHNEEKVIKQLIENFKSRHNINNLKELF